MPLPAVPLPDPVPALLAAAGTEAAPAVQLREIGRRESGRAGVSAVEIPAWGADGRWLFVTDAERGLLRLDASDPAEPREAGRWEAAGVNSAAAAGGRVAVAIAGEDPAGPGRLVVLGEDLVPVAEARTGVGPDMVAALPGGGWVTADEGQPVGEADPAGGVTAWDAIDAAPRTVALGDAGGPRSADPAVRGLEPEYAAVSADGATAWVVLQETNAVAAFDLAAGRFTDVLELGLLDCSAAGAGLDGSDRDGGPTVRPWPVWALPQPDAVALREVGGRTFLLTANEGEAVDAVRAAELTLDPDAFPDAARLQRPERLGRLEVVCPGAHPAVDPDGDGDADRLVAFGGRSLSVWEASGVPGARTLSPVWDSGDALERLAAERSPRSFNAGTGEPDTRSDQRGPEPEGLVIGEVAGRALAFLGLERSHAVVVFDVTDPETPSLAGSVSSEGEDSAPEGLAFLPAARSPTGVPLLAVAFEESGTVAIYAVERAERQLAESPTREREP